MRWNARDAYAHGESVTLDVSLEPGCRLPQTAFERLILERDTVLNELVWQRRKWLLPVPRLNEALTWLAPQCGEPLLAALERARGVRRPEQVEDFCLRNHLAQPALVLCPRLELFIGVRGDAKAVIFLTCLAERLAIAVAVGDEDRVVDVARDDQAPWSAGGAVLRSGFVKGKRDVDAGDGHHRSGIDVDPPALLGWREAPQAQCVAQAVAHWLAQAVVHWLAQVVVHLLERPLKQVAPSRDPAAGTAEQPEERPPQQGDGEPRQAE